MTDLMPIEPGDTNDQQADPGAREQPRDQAGARRRGPAHDVNRCLDVMEKLAGAVAAGFLKPAQANVMRATYTELLRNHQRSERRPEGPGIADADIAALLRADPTILAMLEPFLTAEQVELVMRHATEGDDARQA